MLTASIMPCAKELLTTAGSCWRTGDAKPDIAIH